MVDPSPLAPITAIVYRAGQPVDTLMQAIAALLGSRGVAVAGFIQVNRERPGRSRCDMALKDVSTGMMLEISEDRGPMARGCMLDVDQLMRATVVAIAELAKRPDVLLINKYGKTEALGSGFRPLLAHAMANGTPVVIAVPASNLDSWRHFAGDMAREVDADALADAPDGSLLDRLGLEVDSVGRGSSKAAREPRAFGATHADAIHDHGSGGTCRTACQ